MKFHFGLASSGTTNAVFVERKSGFYSFLLEMSDSTLGISIAPFLESN
jgi:hypothetical protein